MFLLQKPWFLVILKLGFSLFFSLLWQWLLTPRLTKGLGTLFEKAASPITHSGLIRCLPHMVGPALLLFLLQKNDLGQTSLSLGAKIYLSLAVTMTLHRFVRFMEKLIEESIQIPAFRSYAQLLSLVIALLGIGITACIAMRVSPLMLLSSVGAITAFLTFVFKETIQSFIACVQISLNGLVRKGDHITIDSQKIDGTIKEISLNFIWIEEEDGSTAILPTHKLLSTSFKKR